MDESTVDTITRLPMNLLDRHAYWQRSFRVAAILKALATHFRQTWRQVFTSDLFYDIWQLKLGPYISECCAALLKQQAASNFLLFRIERSDIDLDHVALGAKVIRLRNFPQVIEQDIRDWRWSEQQETFNPLVSPVHIAASMENGANEEHSIESMAKTCCSCVEITRECIEGACRNLVNWNRPTTWFEPASAGELQ